MKLKAWLPEFHGMSYSQFKELPENEQWMLRDEHRIYCRNKQIHDRKNWRPMTVEEKERCIAWHEKERERYEINLKIGGIDGRGNYTALSHRWENGY